VLNVQQWKDLVHGWRRRPEGCRKDIRTEPRSGIYRASSRVGLHAVWRRVQHSPACLGTADEILAVKKVHDPTLTPLDRARTRGASDSSSRLDYVRVISTPIIIIIMRLGPQAGVAHFRLQWRYSKSQRKNATNASGPQDIRK